MARTWTDEHVPADRRRTRRAMVALATAVVAATAAAGGASDAARASEPTTDVIVRTHGATAAAAAVVERSGGRVTRTLRLIDGFAASVPGSAVARLRGTPGVVTVAPDARVRFLGSGAGSPAGTGVADRASLTHVAEVVGAVDAYRAGYTGKGVDVATIDTGIVPVDGLTSGNVINGADLSFDSQFPEVAHLDAVGHGTHMASLIAGRDRVATPEEYAGGAAGYHGIAPDARVVSVKVAASDGSTDVSQVIAAIDWVVSHRDDGDVRIRVLSLSFGTDSTQSPDVDPLAYAVESAWRNGIVVVAAAGNGGAATPRLLNPAQSPNVIAVGAADTGWTARTRDDAVAAFSNGGTPTRHVDVVAPGVSIPGLRVPGSLIDDWHPSATGARVLRGTGTSQATAVTAGAVALLLQRHPNLTPDQVKSQLQRTAGKITGSALTRGSGMVDVGEAIERPVARGSQPAPGYGDGTGTLEGARGSLHVDDGEVELSGEQDIFGRPWDPATWAPLSARGEAWVGGTWNGSEWTGTGWATSGWAGKTWVGKTWVGNSWTGKTWVGNSWTGKTWVGKTWVGKTWVGNSWTGNSWTGNSWTGKTWVGKTWVGKTWVGKTWVTYAWE